MKIKKGDKVRVSSRVPRIYERFGSMIAPHYECKVVEIDDGMALLDSIPAKHIFLFPLKYLIKVDAEAEEESEMDAEMQLHKSFQRHMADCIAESKKHREEYIKSIQGCMSGEIYTQSDFLKDYDPAKHEVNPKPRCIPKIMFNTEFWVKYEADFAKDIALKVANRYNDPEETAKYAAKAAKQIVKHLKENK